MHDPAGAEESWGFCPTCGRPMLSAEIDQRQDILAVRMRQAMLNAFSMRLIEIERQQRVVYEWMRSTQRLYTEALDALARAQRTPP